MKIIKNLLCMTFLLFIVSGNAIAQNFQMRQFPAVCMETSNLKQIIQKEKYVLVAFKKEEEFIFMFFANKERKLLFSILKDELACVIINIEGSQGILDWNKFIPGEKA